MDEFKSYLDFVCIKMTDETVVIMKIMAAAIGGSQIKPHQ